LSVIKENKGRYAMRSEDYRENHRRSLRRDIPTVSYEENPTLIRVFMLSVMFSVISTSVSGFFFFIGSHVPHHQANTTENTTAFMRSVTSCYGIISLPVSLLMWSILGCHAKTKQLGTEAGFIESAGNYGWLRKKSFMIAVLCSVIGAIALAEKHAPEGEQVSLKEGVIRWSIGAGIVSAGVCLTGLICCCRMLSGEEGSAEEKTPVMGEGRSRVSRL
jgi:hypothetical protein